MFLAALGWTGKLGDLLPAPEINIPSEDGTEDFPYHLVGLGHAFVTNVKNDPGPTIEIARSDSYVESFRYVLEGCRRYYPL